MRADDPIRLIDGGLVSALRSQSIYHAVAHTFKEGRTPDTVILVSPTDPYVSIGIHQELEKEVDTAYCRGHDLPIVRREVGGGAVYLDRDQLFVQWVFGVGHLPSQVEERFALYVCPLVATYRDLGIDAYYRPINDVHVAGRKIGGTGAARIRRTDVVVGSFMLDFNRTAMARVLKVPSEKMRDKVSSALTEYMVTMRDLLPRVPSRDDIMRLYVHRCEESLDCRLLAGELTRTELDKAQELDQLLSSRQWLRQRSGLERPYVKIHEDVTVVDAVHKAPGGVLRVTARLHGDILDDVGLSGDFFMSPTTGLNAIEDALIGSRLDRGSLEDIVFGLFAAADLQSPGLAPEDIVTAMMRLRR